MVSVKELKNKNNEVLRTQDGKVLKEYRFEAGDLFIPVFNSVLEKIREVEVKGKKQKIVDYKIKAKVKHLGKELFKDDEGNDEVFITLTPTQANTLKNKIVQGIELNQNLFCAYSYESEKYGEQIGVGLKKANKPAKSFEDFEENNK